MSNPLVSVLVPAYKAAPYLKELCDSLQGQTYQNFEVLILDDGSPDNTQEVFKPYRNDRRFKITSWADNRGVSLATLALFQQMQGEFWCYPGADDVLAPEFIARRLFILQENSGASMVHGAAKCIDENGQPVASLPELNIPPLMNSERALSALLQHNFINTPSIFVRSSVTKKVLPFLEINWRYAQDWFYWLLHMGTGADLLWDPEPLHKYRIHSQSLTNVPAHAVTRWAEIRLVPLCGLSIASAFSQSAAAMWQRWRGSLYALWLRRAYQINAENLRRREWLEIGARAFYEKTVSNVSLTTEILRHGLKILGASLAERRCREQQRFLVSGLAQVHDPIFEKE
jgi:glycosyltransferase involved in cell wall biosynthesis